MSALLTYSQISQTSAFDGDSDIFSIDWYPALTYVATLFHVHFVPN